ncbi:MAG: porin family protein [Bacteroidales bacterium]|nr:porin family protein [Bacteroidales bacterium]
MRKHALILLAAAALLIPSLARAQQADTTMIDLDFNIIDRADSIYASPAEDEPVLRDKSRKDRKSKRDIRKATDTLVFDDLFLDTLEIKKKVVINDYSMLGVQYGAGLSSAMFNPSRSMKMRISPVNFGVMYTRYGKMFQYMPYFGLQIGAFYETEGYGFKKDKETGEPSYTQFNADGATFHTVDLSALAHCHIDFWKMKLIVNLGYYVGYRLDITRYRDGEIIGREFNEYEKRFDYGLKGGVGFGFVFDPVEFHLQATYKHSFNALFSPDYASPYYYRYAYPFNIVISAGLHFQLTKRVGKTTRQIKAEAKQAVFNPNPNPSDNDKQSSTDW